MSTLIPKRYNNVAISLHWILAILIIGLLILGYFLEDIPKGPLRKDLFVLHKSFGLIVFTLVIFRIYWRLKSLVPDHVAGGDLQVNLAKYAHIAIYVLIAFVPAIALVAGSFNRGFDFFSWHWSPLFETDKDLAHLLMDAHGFLAYVLLGFLALHISAAIWHQFIKKDGLFRRIWFSKD